MGIKPLNTAITVHWNSAYFFSTGTLRIGFKDTNAALLFAESPLGDHQGITDDSNIFFDRLGFDNKAAIHTAARGNKQMVAIVFNRIVLIDTLLEGVGSGKAF